MTLSTTLISRPAFFVAALLATAAGTGARAEVLRTGWVPNSFLPQGQVQLVAETNVLSVNVVLNTRFMDRVVNAIIKKEQGNWPAGHPDASAYVANLKLARADVKHATGGKGRESLMISFVLSPGSGMVHWATGEISDRHGTLVMASPKVIRSFTPSRDYLYTNALLILEDSLGVPLEEGRKLLASQLDGKEGGAHVP